MACCPPVLYWPKIDLHPYIHMLWILTNHNSGHCFTGNCVILWTALKALSLMLSYSHNTKEIQHYPDHVSLSTFLPFQTQAYHNVSVTPPAEKTMPGMAMLLGAVGIGMCGYSSRQLALHHRPSARVLQWVGSHTDASMMRTAAHRKPLMEVTRPAGACQEIPSPSFVGQKVPWNNLWC